LNTFFLERFCEHPKMGTFGILITPQSIYQTVEQPWNDNKPFQSCVPAGIYTLREYASPRFGLTFALEGGTVALTRPEVDANPELKRYACLFHSANHARQLQGCIAPGMELGAINREWAVMSSTTAMKHLLPEMHDGDTLIISWKGGLSQ
jgi:hypothetical protein